MPEGHILHRLADATTEQFAGRRVNVSSPQGRFAESAALLHGRVLEGAEAWGKHLFIDFAPGDDADGEHIVHIHLGLIGRLGFAPLADPVGEVRLRIDDGHTAADLRGPQMCRLVGDAELAATISRLGPDPIRDDADPELAWQRIHRSGRTIASLLMDQRITAGVGNIYRAEVLFRQRVNPMTPGSRLQRRSWLAIWADLVELMRRGVVDGRIDTVREEHSPLAQERDPRDDPHGGEVYVYRRSQMPCLVCGRPIRTAPLEGRNLYWCPTCQRRR